MESTEEHINIKPKNMYASICITQIICILVILIAVIIIKFFFKDIYEKTVVWCEQNVLEHTQTTEIVQEEENSEI